MNNPANGIVLIRELKKQEGPNWCYSSIVQAIIKYYNGQTRSQNNIARSIARINSNNNMECMRDPYDFLEENGFISGEPQRKKTITWDTIISNINQGCPIIIRVSEHYAIISGYIGNKRNDRHVYILDPILSNDGPVIMPHTEFNKNGLKTDYEHRGISSYERMNGYILTKSPTASPLPTIAHHNAE